MITNLRRVQADFQAVTLIYLYRAPARDVKWSCPTINGGRSAFALNRSRHLSFAAILVGSGKWIWVAAR